MQELCLSVLIFREGIQRQQESLQAALRAVVAAGRADPARVWPEHFGKPQGDDFAFPETGADMSGFQWEKTSAAQVADELEMMMRGAHVTLPDQVAQPPPPREPEAGLRPGTGRFRPSPADASELEWG